MLPLMSNGTVRKSDPKSRRQPGRPPKLPEHVRRAVVLDAAVRRFAEVGFDQATVDEIAAATGVRKPSIYELFGTKHDLFRAAVEHEVGELIDFFRVANAETSELPLAERTRRRVDAALTRAESNPHGFRLLARARTSWPGGDPDAVREVRDRLMSVMADNYRRESKAAGTPINAAADLLARVFFTMADEIIDMRLSDESWDREALVEFLASFIEGGMAAIDLDTWQAVERKSHR